VDRVGFYLSGDLPVERVLPIIVRGAKEKGQRMLVVADDEAFLSRLDKALWEYSPGSFLAHGLAGEGHEASQPVLLSTACVAANGANVVAFADGKWRDEAERFERALMFFDESGREAARPAWRQFDQREDVEREYYAVEDGKWVKKA
jgi:DNA polymerase III subunit chi